MRDPHTNESRGFGFVTMESPAEADAAIAALNGQDFFGKTLSIEKVCSSFSIIVVTLNVRPGPERTWSNSHPRQVLRSPQASRTWRTRWQQRRRRRRRWSR